MAEPAAVAWSADQQRLLTAMGYTLWQRPASAATSLASDANSEYVRVQLSESLPAAGKPHAMLQSVIAAAGLRMEQVAFIQAGAATLVLPSLSQLIQDPAARRALWPRLRQMRRLRA